MLFYSCVFVLFRLSSLCLSQKQLNHTHTTQGELPSPFPELKSFDDEMIQAKLQIPFHPPFNVHFTLSLSFWCMLLGLKRTLCPLLTFPTDWKAEIMKGFFEKAAAIPIIYKIKKSQDGRSGVKYLNMNGSLLGQNASSWHVIQSQEATGES